ncbi:kinase-like domain-containing protein [Chlamydoabsidia padenii]|nr:kinase-like domain-containing protein [Chlamydoabsidia padenii]
MHSLYVYTTPATSTHTSPTLIINKYSNGDPGQDGTIESNGPLSDEEDINDYKRGGYHRVQVGDTFHDGRYVIEAKMGWGYFSTVWLAMDTKMKRHVALKIVKSDPHFCKSALEEIELLEQAQRSANNGSHQHVAQLLHHFWHDAGGGGKHVCMVFEVLGESLLSLMKRFNYRGLPLNMVKRITRQILDGLAFLHDTCGIVHTDIKPENILICIPNVEDYLAKQKQPRRLSSSSTLLLDSPATTPVTPNDDRRYIKRKMKRQQKRTEDPPLTGKQKSNDIKQIQSTLSSLSLGIPQQQQQDQLDSTCLPTIIRSSALDCTALMNDTGDDNDDSWHDRITVKIVDLGNACRVDGHFKHVIQTRQYRSPEVIIGMAWNDRADIWSLGCLVFELLTGDYLFDPRADTKYGKDDDHLAKIIELMRVLPRSLIIGGDYSREFFTQKGELRHAKTLRHRRLRDVLHDTYFMPPEQADSISDFLSPMLEVDMNKRASAKTILDHKWLVL